MRHEIRPGYSLYFPNGDSFYIKSIIGRGSSCIVYHAENIKNGTEHLLKEYNPDPTSTGIETYRDKHCTLHPANDQHSESFARGLARFMAGYKLQCDLRKDRELTNVLCNIQNIYDGYGTKFIDMSVLSGQTYDKVTEDSLSVFLKRMIYISERISTFHKKGYLCLDIKPNNLFIDPSKIESVMFFDFDSMVLKSDIGENFVPPYSGNWAPPEQRKRNLYRKIGECSDIYALGMIFFTRVMGRDPDSDEHGSECTYTFDGTESLVNGLPPNAKKHLVRIFHHTICSNADRRWQNVDEFINALKKLQNTIERQSADNVNPGLKSVNTQLHRLRNAVILATLLICVLITVLILSQQGRQEDSLNTEITYTETENHAEMVESNDGFVGFDYNGNELYIGNIVRIGGSASGDRYAVGTIIGVDRVGYAQVKFDSMHYANEYDPRDPHYIEDIETKILSNASDGGYIQLVKTDMLQIYIFTDDNPIETSALDDSNKIQDKYVGCDYFGSDLYIGDTVRISSDINNYRFAVGTVIDCIEPGQAFVEFTDIFDVDSGNSQDRYYLENLEDDFFKNGTTVQSVTRTVSSDWLQKYALTGNESLKSIPTASSKEIAAADTVGETHATEGLSERQYVVDTIAHNVTMLKSMVITNDGVVYYADDQQVYCSSHSKTLNLFEFLGNYVAHVYLAYDSKLDRVYMLHNTYARIYDITDLTNPQEIFIGYDPPPFIDDDKYLGNPIITLPDSTLLRYGNRIDPINGGVTRFSLNNVQHDYDYLKVVGENIVAMEEKSKTATVVPLAGGTPYEIEMEYEACERSTIFAVQDGLVFYADGVGVCKIDLSGKATIMIPQHEIAIKDYQFLDDTDITCLVVSQNGRIVFYDYSLECIRCIDEQSDEALAFFETAFMDKPAYE